MFYIIYKTTNLITNKFYIGRHNTKNLNDGYMGSGKLLKQAILKYGKENFKTEILEYCDNEQHLINREREIVNEEFVKNESTYNMILGGSNLGEGEILSELLKLAWNDEYRKIKHTERFIETIKNLWQNEEYREKMKNYASKQMSEKNKENWQNEEYREKMKKAINNKGRKFIHNDETQQCKSVKQDELESYLNNGWKLGKKYINTGTSGTIWIYNGDNKKSVKKEELEKWLAEGWKKGNPTMTKINIGFYDRN